MDGEANGHGQWYRAVATLRVTAAAAASLQGRHSKQLSHGQACFAYLDANLTSIIQNNVINFMNIVFFFKYLCLSQSLCIWGCLSIIHFAACAVAHFFSVRNCTIRKTRQ